MCTERYGLVDRCSMAHRALAQLTIRKVANRAGANACCPGVGLGLGPRENRAAAPWNGVLNSSEVHQLSLRSSPLAITGCAPHRYKGVVMPLTLLTRTSRLTMHATEPIVT